ncbi:ATP-binding protein [Algoriphagus sp. NF]|uniref:tetratricopeptide repeat-containing sensor histidine kinase n=1 Tax=Algoriphagus sp. NF TaxID=2992756 RepID=UPI001066CB23|nr:ATP-binding protein [Algoriphagus sp. NF]MDE0560089.1 ATP-binding protein [Algoriphagus sp. NF]
MRFVLVWIFVLATPLALFAQRDTFDSLLDRSITSRYIRLDSAWYFLNQAEKIRNEYFPKDPILLGKLENQSGTLYYVNGDYPSSLRHFSNAIAILKDQNSKKDYVYALNGRALIYLSQHEYENSIKVLDECIKINQELQDSVGLGKNYFNKGISESELGNYEEAMISLKTGLNFLSNYPDEPLVPMIINRQAKVYFEMGDFSKSEQTYQQVLNEYPKISNWELTFTYAGLAEIECERKDYTSAIEYGKLALNYAERVDALWDKERASAILSTAYEKAGSYQQALVFSRINKSYSDSLYNQNKNSEISFLQLQLSDAENEVLKQEQESAQNELRLNRKYLILLLIALAVTISGLILYSRLLVKKNKFAEQLKVKQEEIEAKNEKLTSINEEKNKLFSILSHDLKGPVTSIKQLLELSKAGFFKGEEERKSVQDLLTNQVNQTHQLLEELLDWSHAQLDGIITKPIEVNLEETIQKQLNHLSYQAMAKSLSFKFDPPTSPVFAIADPQQLKIILQNCLQNAIKFSKPEGQISIQLSEEKNNILLSIKDEGVGISPEKLDEINNKMVRVQSSPGTHKEKGTGLGLLLVREFIEKNEGSLEIKSELDEGTEILISLPKSKTT